MSQVYVVNLCAWHLNGLENSLTLFMEGMYGAQNMCMYKGLGNSWWFSPAYPLPWGQERGLHQSSQLPWDTGQPADPETLGLGWDDTQKTNRVDVGCGQTVNYDEGGWTVPCGCSGCRGICEVNDAEIGQLPMIWGLGAGCILYVPGWGCKT